MNSLILGLAALISCSAPQDLPVDTGEPVEERPDFPEGWVDEDGDGWSVDDGDCNDVDETIHPALLEECNGIDDNCNGLVDDQLPDSDLDGVCDALDFEECDGLDNDGNGLVDDMPEGEECASPESCNGLDDDFDGQIDEDFDLDGDGATLCGPDGYFGTGDEDCDDEDASVYPGATELSADLVDQDCNGLVDELDWHSGDLVITEMMVAPLRSSERWGEWIEVTNVSGRTVVLDGLVVENEESHRIRPRSPLTVAPGARVVLGDSESWEENGHVDVDYSWHDALLLRSEADAVGISVDGLLLDEVAWDETWPVVPGASLSLDPHHTDALINDDPQAWCAATEPWMPVWELGSPGEANQPCR